MTQMRTTTTAMLVTTFIFYPICVPQRKRETVVVACGNAKEYFYFFGDSCCEARVFSLFNPQNRKHKMRMELGHDKLSSNWPHTTRHQGERKISRLLLNGGKA